MSRILSAFVLFVCILFPQSAEALPRIITDISEIRFGDVCLRAGTLSSSAGRPGAVVCYRLPRFADLICDDCTEDTGGTDADGDGFLAYEDCDDSDAAINPDAEEVCWNETDDNCDGDTDEDCEEIELSSSAIKLLGENTSDLAGWSVSFAGDTNADGFDDLLIGAPCEDSGGTDSGSAYLVQGPITSSFDLSLADAKLIGENAGDQAGRYLSGAGDFNGDGYDDLLIGAWALDYSYGGSYDGAAYIVHGPVSGNYDLSYHDAMFYGESVGDHAGQGVSSVFDMNGDGYDDVVVSSPARNSMAGSVYLINGPLTGVLSLASADAELSGESSTDHAGNHVSSAGDVDGDGNFDLIIGAELESTTAMHSGAAYLVSGPITADMSLSGATAKLLGENYLDSAGSSVAGAGDFNGDGYDDLLIGANSENTAFAGAGAAYVVFGPVTGSNTLSSADAKLLGGSTYGGAGYSSSGCGDVNNDGFDDILVGSHGYDHGSGVVGAAYLVLGPTSGQAALSSVGTIFVGESAAGIDVAGYGDSNADGWNDLLIGDYSDSSSGTNTGAVYLVLGEGF
jgi:hypothetical protein